MTPFKNKIVFPGTGSIYSLILKRSRDRFSQNKTKQKTKKKREREFTAEFLAEDDYAEVPLLIKFFHTVL